MATGWNRWCTAWDWSDGDAQLPAPRYNSLLRSSLSPFPRSLLRYNIPSIFLFPPRPNTDLLWTAIYHVRKETTLKARSQVYAPPRAALDGSPFSRYLSRFQREDVPPSRNQPDRHPCRRAIATAPAPTQRQVQQALLALQPHRQQLGRRPLRRPCVPYGRLGARRQPSANTSNALQDNSPPRHSLQFTTGPTKVHPHPRSHVPHSGRSRTRHVPHTAASDRF